MATEVKKGQAILWGVGASENSVGIGAYAGITETAKAQHKFKFETVEDEAGFDKALIGTNEHYEADVTFILEADSATGFLEPLATVSLSGFAGDALNGSWIYIGDSSVDLSHKAGKFTLKLRKYLNNQGAERTLAAV